jgi:hypothetical protein
MTFLPDRCHDLSPRGERLSHCMTNLRTSIHRSANVSWGGTDMPAHVKPSPTGLIVILERDGVVIELVDARDGRHAVLRVAEIVIGQGELRAGDCLRVIGADGE